MPRYIRKRLGAVAEVILLVAFFRWQGWYGLLEPVPWLPAIGMAVGITLVTLRLLVVLERNI